MERTIATDVSTLPEESCLNGLFHFTKWRVGECGLFWRGAILEIVEEENLGMRFVGSICHHAQTMTLPLQVSLFFSLQITY